MVLEPDVKLDREPGEHHEVWRRGTREQGAGVRPQRGGLRHVVHGAVEPCLHPAGQVLASRQRCGAGNPHQIEPQLFPSKSLQPRGKLHGFPTMGEE